MLFMAVFSGCLFFAEPMTAGDEIQCAPFSGITTSFDALDAVSVDLERWKTYTNENGALAWGTSYLLDAYLDMF